MRILTWMLTCSHWCPLVCVCNCLHIHTLYEYVSLLHGEGWPLYSLAYFLRFIRCLRCQSMYLSSAYADNMRDVTGIPLLASLATLSLVTASQMAGQLCALICALCVCVCVCMCVCVRVCLSSFTLSRIVKLATDSGHCSKFFYSVCDKLS